MPKNQKSFELKLKKKKNMLLFFIKTTIRGDYNYIFVLVNVMCGV